MKNDILLQKKWRKLLRYRPLFLYIPFLDFVFVSGSLALGNVHEDSDFDVIIGVRSGRIFTIRAFCIFLFGILGIRRRGIDHKTASSDKVCFNHFVTPASYRFQPPYNDYWKKLYRNLVPIHGSEKAAEKFFGANDWALSVEEAEQRMEIFKEKYLNFSSGILKYAIWIFRAPLEVILTGFFGNLLEAFLKKIQIQKIEKGIREGTLGHKPRVRYNDDELEFHPDTIRIERILESEYSVKSSS